MKRRVRKRFTSVGCVTALASAMMLGGPALAELQDPYTLPDDAWITLSGEVTSVSEDSFMLDYGDGVVKVEMDDGDRDADAYKLIEGDDVRVAGRIDDDFFELTTIEASSVYVANLGTTFFASALDEESYEAYDPSLVYLVDTDTIVSGTVESIEGTEFRINTGGEALRVETAHMPYNPLDDEGYLKINEGDRVRVVGDMDVDLFEGRELEAESLVKLSSSKKNKMTENDSGKNAS